MKDKESFIDEGHHSGNAWEWHQVCEADMPIAAQSGWPGAVPDSNFRSPWLPRCSGGTYRTTDIGTTILNGLDRT